MARCVTAIQTLPCAVVHRHRDETRLVAAIAPRVIRAAQNHGVARAQVDLLQIEHQRDVAFEYQREIERVRFLQDRKSTRLNSSHG